ncbi:MAG: hypothetical protein KDD47_24855, partial [Acidobacteria bacterium]|nr:hypothetical protein [Acidobacteriota bacterium]
AAEWLEARIRDTKAHEVIDWEIFEAATHRLRPEQRVHLLRLLPRSRIWEPLVRFLVAKDEEVFRNFLEMRDLRFAHLAPLGGAPDEPWGPLALAALDAGRTAREIVCESLDGDERARLVHPGSWRPWRQGFEALADNEDPRLREVAREGLRLVEEREEADRRCLRETEIEGIHAAV